MSEKLLIKKTKKNTEVTKNHANILEDQGSETDYGLEKYYNTESRACPLIFLNL